MVKLLDFIDGLVSELRFRAKQKHEQYSHVNMLEKRFHLNGH